jgi:hypothetical protein
MTITQQWADAFAREWMEAWNAHDLDRVMYHYTDDFEMSSPFITQLTGEASGTLKGKERVFAYWKSAFEKFPDLRFHLEGAFAGASSIVIHYRASFGSMATEILFFNSAGLVYRAAAHYQTIPTPPGGDNLVPSASQPLQN